MKALTIWQPWASLIILGHKPYEFRKWSAHRIFVGQRIAIHAGARPAKKKEIADLIDQMQGNDAWLTGLRSEALPWLKNWHADPDCMFRSAVVGTAVLGEPVSADAINHEFGGPVNDSDRSDHALYAWPMLDIEAFQPPIPAKGAQGFWNWNGS